MTYDVNKEHEAANGGQTTLHAAAALGFEPAQEEAAHRAGLDPQWQKAMKGFSDFLAGLKAYDERTQKDLFMTSVDFFQAFDEQGMRNSMPLPVIIALMREFTGLGYETGSKRLKEFALELSELLGDDEKQELYKLAVKVTKL